MGGSGSGSGLGNYPDGGAGNVEDVLLRIRHGAFESSVNLLLQREGVRVDRADEEIDDPRLEAIRLALRDGIGEVNLRLLGSSDVLAVFTTTSISERSPNEVIVRMIAVLEDLKALQSDIETVSRENFEVIVAYTDAMRYRLTPAVTTDRGVTVPSSDSSSWILLGNR